MSEYGITAEVEYSYSEAIEKTKEVLADHGFGVLSEIEVSEKLREKLDVDFDDYMILGACNPEKAYQGLKEEQELGLLLPCNVIVYRENGKTFVSAIKASKALEVAGNEDLEPIAEEVEKDLKKVINEVKQ
ncbi:DUF302 domain-containing protein [Candidatus Nanohalovita haloferacivicina]|jgi:uncharacterized protein (DUF302 family)|uniref:DUF302 domain-containing protein n=1 Tax=Candidatus Nanohalovita haloferacivicina TaxID=2978046 RepID=UPI00325FC324|nr:DUF302 family protein [Candidatus Nanohalobia archaeon BNXNv]